MEMATVKAFDFLGLPGVNFYGFDYNKQSTEKENDALFEKRAIEKYSQLEKSALFQKKFKRYPTHVTFFPPSHIEIFPETSFSFGNAISCFELSMVDSPGSRGHYNTFFQGLFIEIKQKQFYENPIVFVKKGFFNSRKTLKKVPLRMQDSYFDIYSNDVMQAQNLFNARVATKLLKIKEAFNVKKVEASFYQDKLYIALYTQKDFFELENNLLDIKQYEDFYDDVAEIEKYCQQFTDL